jgi:Fe-S-cluster-containing hydrogenase component 2
MTYDDWKADVANREGSAPEDSEDLRAEDVLDEPEPYICPGCYAVDDEPCAAYCPDDEIRREAEEQRLMPDWDERCDEDEDDQEVT